MSTEIFKTKPEAFNELRKAMLIRLISFGAIGAFGGLVIEYYSSTHQHSSTNIYPGVITIVILAMSFGIFRGIKRQKEIFTSYTLTITNDVITREQPNTASISIPFSDITQIVKNATGSFTIKGQSALNIIGVLPQIDNYHALEKRLNDIYPITTNTGNAFLQKFQNVLVIVPMALMGAVYISNNKLIVGISASIVVPIMCYAFFKIWQNKNVDNRTKKGTLFLIVVLLSIIGITYYKLTWQA